MGATVFDGLHFVKAQGFGVDFVFKVVAGSSGTVSPGVASLDHELLDDAVKLQPVIKRALHLRLRLMVDECALAHGEVHEVRHRLGRFFGEHFDVEVAKIRLHQENRVGGFFLYDFLRERGRSHEEREGDCEYDFHRLSPDCI